MEHDGFRKGAHHEPPLLNPSIGMCRSHQRMRPAQCARGKQLQRTGASRDQKFLLRPLRRIWIGQRHVAAAGLRSARHRSTPRGAIVRSHKTRLRTCALGDRRGRWKPTRASGHVVTHPARLSVARYNATLPDKMRLADSTLPNIMRLEVTLAAQASTSN